MHNRGFIAVQCIYSANHSVYNHEIIVSTTMHGCLVNVYAAEVPSGYITLLKTAHQGTQSDVTDPVPENGYQESFVTKYQP